MQWDAKDYALHSSAQQKWALELIQKLHLTGTEHILDLGCGDGKITILLHDQVPHGSILGIDKSPEMINLAQTTYPSSKYSRLSFAVQDAQTMQYESQFDIVFSNAVLHWIKDHRMVLKNIARALHSGGKILLQMGGKGNALEILEIFDDLILYSKWKAYFEGFEFPYGFYEPNEYQKWLIDAGLSPIRVELIPKDMVQSSKGGLQGWIRTTWLPYLQRIPETLRNQFIEEIIASYQMKHPPDSSGNFHVKMVRLEVEALKRIK